MAEFTLMTAEPFWEADDLSYVTQQLPWKTMVEDAGTDQRLSQRRSTT